MVDLLDSYRANGPGHDEMLQSTGPTRAAWAELAEQARLGSTDRLESARAEVVALLEDQGVSRGDGWQLDPVPMLVDEHEWHHLDGALRQRAELLDQILTDLYGERRLLTSGLLPPEIVLSHPGFVRAADGIRIPGHHQLFHTSAEIARNADGAWTVLADRSDVPVGLGYAMADRRVVAEVLAGPYRRSRTRRVGPFFQAMREALQAAAPAGSSSEPRVALLTAGPAGRTAFDLGYLSVLLGVPLVEGGDLVVEDGRVWTRALGPREPVDVLLRGVPATEVDPLDLDRGSTGGTAGLVHAVRAGAVTVVNTLGAGVLESPALLSYLPRLARALHGEELLVPSVATYWCGERSMCSHVIANLGRLVLRPVAGREDPTLGWELTLDERADLAVRIAARPGSWVGQEPVEASTTPTVDGASLVPRATSLRTFAVSRAGTYLVMSGALGHVGPVPQAAVTSTEVIGTAKDVWVLAAEPSVAAVPDQPDLDVLPGRFPDAVISARAGENLFWLGRRTQQAEGAVRLLLATADRWDDHAGPRTVPGHPGAQALELLLAALRTTAADAPLSALVTDTHLTGSVAWTVARMSRCAAGVRDNLTPDVWVALSSLERALGRERRRQSQADAEAGLVPVLTRLQEGLLALHGIYSESLVRDVGWRLLEVGRRLERARQLVATLAAAVTVRPDRAVEALVIESLLAAHESSITYRRRYPAGGLGAMLELLLSDGANPRSLIFQLDRLTELVRELPAEARGSGSGDRLLTEVFELLTELRTDRAVTEEVQGRRVHLAQTLESMRWRLDELGEEITRVHLVRPVTATLTGPG